MLSQSIELLRRFDVLEKAHQMPHPFEDNNSVIVNPKDVAEALATSLRLAHQLPSVPLFANSTGK